MVNLVFPFHDVFLSFIFFIISVSHLLQFCLFSTLGHGGNSQLIPD